MLQVVQLSHLIAPLTSLCCLLKLLDQLEGSDRPRLIVLELWILLLGCMLIVRHDGVVVQVEECL